MDKIKAICFGEVLVDQFPTGDKPGGAPMNVAYHMKNLGTHAAMMSSIGGDEVGKGLMDFMNSIGLDTSLVQEHQTFPTGTVQVDISDKSEAKYTIVEGVAWDEIRPIEDYSVFSSVDYLVHGSLALRTETNRKTLEALKQNLQAKVVFDLNLRPPFYSQEMLMKYISESHIVKLNDEEFEMVADWLGVSADDSGLADFGSHFPGVEMFLVTRGGDGAWVQTTRGLIKSRSYEVEIVDTVGAGDSFLGSFIHCQASEKSVQESIDFACATGALVASRAGANPVYSEEDILKLIR